MKQLRRTMLYVPGNSPGMIKDAGIFPADCIMFDLEDSVSISEKDSARFLVYEALSTLSYPGKELLVRINSPATAIGAEDIRMIVPTGKVVIRLPKTESAGDIIACEALIEQAERKAGIPLGQTRMMAAVESAAGVLNAKEIAFASPRIMGIAIGAEDYVTDLHTTRSPGGLELMFGRSMVLLAARAAGIDAIDTVFSSVNDIEGLTRETELIKQMGFDGKSIVHPRQIKPIHKVFAPQPEEIEHAASVIWAADEAARKGSGVIALDGKMIDKPVVERARRVLNLAAAMGAAQGEASDEY